MFNHELQQFASALKPWKILTLKTDRDKPSHYYVVLYYGELFGVKELLYAVSFTTDVSDINRTYVHNCTFKMPKLKEEHEKFDMEKKSYVHIKWAVTLELSQAYEMCRYIDGELPEEWRDVIIRMLKNCKLVKPEVRVNSLKYLGLS